MTTTTLHDSPPLTLHFISDAGISSARRSYKKADKKTGKAILVHEGVPVFRSGSFRDSWGDLMTWEDLHIRQMVANHDYLKGTGTFSDVPVRKGHGGFLSDPMDGLVGYITALTAEEKKSPIDGQRYTYLLADYEILDEDAQAKINSGLWRNRSAEIGHFMSNQEAEYWPTFMGFAWVDIPAVEGLHLNGYSKGRPDDKTEFSMLTPKRKGDIVANKHDSDKDDEGASKAPAAKAPAKAAPAKQSADPLGDDFDTPPSVAVNPDAPTVDGEQVTGAPAGAEGSHVVLSPTFEDDEEESDEPIEQNEDLSQGGPVGVDHEDEDEDEEEEEDNEPIPLTEVPPGPVFGANGKLTGHFVIGGRKTLDFSKVQKHINSLEAAQTEARTAARKSFCKRLAKDGKILASDIDTTTNFALALSDAQYETWSAMQSRAPQNSLFAKQPGGQADTRQRASDTSEYEISKEIVLQHKRSGVRPEVLAEYASFAKFHELGKKLGKTDEEREAEIAYTPSVG